jgi:pimeloyl-ACP methyl ester carboxylesterase
MQELALLLIKQQRLASLYLAVSCAGRMLLANRLPFQLGLLLLNLYVVRLLVPLFFGWPRRWMVAHLLAKCFHAECLDAQHPSGATYREAISREYVKSFSDLWTFGDHNACAGHVNALASHHLSGAKAAAIRRAGVRVTVQVATHDRLVPPHMQLELAAMLDARVAAFHTGHVGWHMHKEGIFAALLAHLGQPALGPGALP